MRVLHLYNVFGLLTEKVMLEVPLALGPWGVDLHFAAESFEASAPTIEAPLQQLQRIAVEPTDDVPGQMARLAEEAPGVAGEFDLVHGHFGPRLLHAVRWATRGVPAVVSCYGYDTSRLLRDPCWAERYRWAGEHGVTFIALSRAMRDTLADCGVPAERLRVIPLGIELDQWPFDPQPPPPEGPRFLFVGRFVPKKGLDTLLHALASLRRSGVRAGLDVIGGGDEALPALAASLGLDDAVRFVGTVPYEQLGDWMRRATALVAPSRIAPDGDAEGCPMVLMQAQACGCPAITTRHAGNPEALPREAQRFVVPEDDVEALAGAMRAMVALTDAQRTDLSRAGRAWIESHFDLRRTVGACAALYDELKRRPP
jgi:glycosyltransferase involved in cell wall biosynthesis